MMSKSATPPREGATGDGVHACGNETMNNANWNSML
jgi:hypothetical protein